ncbi:AAA family ATPase [Nocardia aurantia]|uniref:AAA family ATPase n=1 Tax=Nocardia aurantia TaxID=2585199 RepID=UPI0029E80E3F|nr:AAA family ATPase [Nocardia aurantia]
MQRESEQATPTPPVPARSSNTTATWRRARQAAAAPPEGGPAALGAAPGGSTTESGEPVAPHQNSEPAAAGPKPSSPDSPGYGVIESRTATAAPAESRPASSSAAGSRAVQRTGPRTAVTPPQSGAAQSERSDTPNATADELRAAALRAAAARAAAAQAAARAAQSGAAEPSADSARPAGTSNRAGQAAAPGSAAGQSGRPDPAAAPSGTGHRDRSAGTGRSAGPGAPSGSAPQPNSPAAAHPGAVSNPSAAAHSGVGSNPSAAAHSGAGPNSSAAAHSGAGPNPSGATHSGAGSNPPASPPAAEAATGRVERFAPGARSTAAHRPGPGNYGTDAAGAAAEYAQRGTEYAAPQADSAQAAPQGYPTGYPAAPTAGPWAGAASGGYTGQYAAAQYAAPGQYAAAQYAAAQQAAAQQAAAAEAAAGQTVSQTVEFRAAESAPPAAWQQRATTQAADPSVRGVERYQQAAENAPFIEVLPAALTSADLLADISAANRAKLKSATGVRGALNKVGFNLGLSPAEQRVEDRRARIRKQLLTTYQIAVISVKGGVGRTTLAATLGSTFSALRPDRVVAIDANPDFGDLPSRTAPHPYGLSLRDLAQASNLDAFATVQSFMSINSADLAVVASPWNSEAVEALSGGEYMAAMDVLRRHYNLLMVDCGTGVLDSVTTSVLRTSDAVVVVTPATVGGVKGAVATLNWLNTHGLSQLIAKSVVAIVHQQPTKPIVEIEAIEKLFQTAQRPTALIPYDPHLAEGGEIDLRLLDKDTLLAFEELAAGLSDGFPNSYLNGADRGGWR